MNYISVCSGIEAVTVAWESLGFNAVAFSEIDKFPSALLSHYYPKVPNLGDIKGVNRETLRKSGVTEKIHILVGGTPCQSFSLAGQRKGLDDERGNLSLEFVRLANECNPDFIVWENVPGVLSDRGNAFGAFLAQLSCENSPFLPPRGKWTSRGYVLGKFRTIAWRVLDAQYFGVPQRRRRVFLIASPRNRYDPRKILFEFDGVCRSSPPSRKKGQDVARTIKASFGKGSYGSSTPTGIIPQVAGTLTLNTGASNGGRICPEHIVCNVSPHRTIPEPQVFNGTQDPICAENISNPCGKNHGLDNCVLAFAERRREHGKNIELQEDLSFCLVASQGSDKADSLFDNKGFVRRLTPLECERLQGFPDNYTLIPYGKSTSSDSARYKALGNSMAVPVMHWIGKRIKQFSSTSDSKKDFL